MTELTAQQTQDMYKALYELAKRNVQESGKTYTTNGRFKRLVGLEVVRILNTISTSDTTFEQRQPRRWHDRSKY